LRSKAVIPEPKIHRVVSVSLGSSRRDLTVRIQLGGLLFEISRVGTDGSLQKAQTLIAELDGKVSAIGLGGIDLYLRVGDRKYTIRDAYRMARVARSSPVVDGGGLKASLERALPALLVDRLQLNPPDHAVLMVSAADRYGLAEGFVKAGFPTTFGDLIFALGLPVPLRTLRSLRLLAALLLPVLCRLPFRFLYPTGEKQDQSTPKHHRYFSQNTVIAGDFHFIRRYAPEDLRAKAVVSNTVTSTDKAELTRRGVRWLVTTTPEREGRSFGTNVWEAALVAYSRATKGDVHLPRQDPLTAELPPDEYITLARELRLEPRIERLNP
jgi:hypothetical protein